MLFQMDPQCSQSFGDMLLHRFFRDSQLLGDFAVGESLATEYKHLPALVGQSVQPFFVVMLQIVGQGTLIGDFGSLGAKYLPLVVMALPGKFLAVEAR